MVTDESGVLAALSGFSLRDDIVETALQTGEHAGLLEDYFGTEEYEELCQLARDAAIRSVRGPRVLILPGIMGSKIGVRRRLGIFNDVYWIDPLDIRRGRLRELALEPPLSKRFLALGVVLLAYLRLRLRLRADGYNADFYPFDWRLSIADLGKALKRRLDKEGSAVMLVAHSMGGLVARYAIGAAGGKCRRLIMLGTPNHGSFAPVQALRAVYPVVRKVAWLDRRHTAEDLARDVFSTFPGLSEMLPDPERYDLIDLYDAGNWPDPASGLRPRQPILDRVAEVRAGLAPADRTDTILVAGVDRETVVNVKPDLDPGQGFFYERSHEGDGTVPLALALLAGARTYYVEESHGSLANNRQVGEAVIELLDRGETGRLATSWSAAPARRAIEAVPESELRVDPYDARRGTVLSQRELREILAEVAAPGAEDGFVPAGLPAAGAPAEAPPELDGYRHRFDRVVVGRRRQHRLDLRFAYGSITEVDSRAIVLGIFRDVTPSGAASALDARVGGAITEIARRRMFSGNVGEIFMLPTGRHPIAAEMIAFVGLGAFDRFTGNALQASSENVIRTFVHARVEEFATVLYGGGSGADPAELLRNMLIGLLRGLQDADSDHGFRRIVICENDAERFVQLKEAMFRLSSTDLCRDVEITFDEVELSPALEAPAAVLERRRRAPRWVYLIVREQSATGDGAVEIRSSVLTAGDKATVVTGVSVTDPAELDRSRRDVTRASGRDLARVGARLGRLVLAPEARQVLQHFHDNHLVVVHDGPMSRVPWETVALEGQDGTTWFPAAGAGVSRRYAADNLSVGKWLETRIEDGVLSVLLVVDPTVDLAGAREEGARVRQMFQAIPGCRIDVLWQEQATRQALLAAFGSGRYDVIHYAGHAFFDEANPERSGVLCAHHVPLSGVDLAGLSNLPALAFFNACEAGRVRGDRETAAAIESMGKSVGLAEAFMRGGIANFIGTYWLVGDRAAEAFAGRFYESILRGDPIGDALQAGRQVVRDQVRSTDWANYLFYGSPDFVLKELPVGPAPPAGGLPSVPVRAMKEEGD
jgi:pimeloyl-ACP methyl ester carboxylesterase